MNRKCKRCQKEFDVSFFNKHKGKKDGIDIYCKNCTRELCRGYIRKTPRRISRKAISAFRNETWKNIQGYDGFYMISDLGRVKSLERFVRMNANKIRFCAEQIIVTRRNRGGYEVVQLSKEGNSWPTTVHRLVATAFILNPQNKPHINHIDGDKTNNVVSNLEWCTAQENVHHYYSKGLKKPKISDTEVVYIRKLYNSGVSLREIVGIIGKSSPVYLWSIVNYRARTLRTT